MKWSFNPSVTKTFRIAFLTFTTALLMSCGGGGGGDGPSTGVRCNNCVANWVSGVFEDASNYVAQCAMPRTGTDSHGDPFPDTQGTIDDEKFWLRSWSNDLYLWYDEIVDRDPRGSEPVEDYFDQLKTNQTTVSGNNKDNFHFSISTDEWDALSQSGTTYGYGANWTFFGNNVFKVPYPEPGSPADLGGVQRGDEILLIDGLDIHNLKSQAEVDAANEGLYPSVVGADHDFRMRRVDSSTYDVTLTSAVITIDPVPLVDTFSTGTGNVGYLLFNDHIATAEAELIDAVNQLNSVGISDLILDLRYNGGGYLAIASQLAYMIAGSGTTGQTFEDLVFNDKYQVTNPVTGQPLTPTPFYSTTVGLSSLPSGQPLPTLNLTRVYVLTGTGTCSASESIINSLRGVDIEVIQIGSTTCGKPYGFYPEDNCGVTYFTIEFKGENAKGFGEYSDGFSPSNTVSSAGELVPGCSVRDDFTHNLGDMAEERIAAALNYRATMGTCPTPSGFAAPSLVKSAVDGNTIGDGILRKSQGRQNRIMTK